MSRQNAYALVVGIGRYRDEAITPLKFTNADAEAFADLLTDESICGIPKENVRLLVDEEATLFAIKDSISGWLSRNAGPDSTAIIFYAGHGDVEPDRTQSSQDAIANYLLPYDTNSSNLYASALSKEEFQGLVRTVRCKRSVILMDACHSGGVATAGSRKMSVGYSKDLYSSLAEGAGSTVIAAAAPNQLSWEDKSLGHGIFTHHLLEALRGEADADGDGRITMTEVFDYLKRKVPESARKLGGAEQTPVFKADMSEDIVLTINPERIAGLAREAEEKAEAERKRIQEARERLYAFEKNHSIPARAHNRANLLIEKPLEELTPEERATIELMNAMVAGHVSVDTFVKHCDSQVPEPRRPDPPPPVDPNSPERKGDDANGRKGGEKVRPVDGGVSSGMNLVMVLLSLFMPLVGVIAGVYFMGQAEPSKKRAGKRWLWVGCASLAFWFLFVACAAIIAGLEGGYSDPYY
ncbi:caspase family protein [Pelagicoccus sp. SDUM812005]|uniref:caspase family protein n=1 Tax=Pelagicoccus sp. SDUM812005 TaxID=3041257 RepID=UPI00280CC32F|nr:caspase family protein [Pelagicoccus sp. SDUM812005]MDQ8181715.1 caspase family protein [Pelagicoccus sp. SDUM812005]